MGVGKAVKAGGEIFDVLLVIGLTGLLFLIVFGNLSGNLGFTVGSQGANDTNAVIGNLTTGAVSFFGFANTWMTLVAVMILIGIIFAVIRVVRGKEGGSGSFSS